MVSPKDLNSRQFQSGRKKESRTVQQCYQSPGGGDGHVVPLAGISHPKPIKRKQGSGRGSVIAGTIPFQPVLRWTLAARILGFDYRSGLFDDQAS
jgi:hypothetical protein